MKIKEEKKYERLFQQNMGKNHIMGFYRKGNFKEFEGISGNLRNFGGIMNVKKTSIYCVVIFIGVLIISTGITVGIFLHRAIGQRDIRIRELEHQLTEQTDTIRRCRETVGDISRELGEDITGLQGTIGKLRKIRDRVEDLERCLDNTGNSVSDNDNYGPDSKIVGQK